MNDFGLGAIAAHWGPILGALVAVLAILGYFFKRWGRVWEWLRQRRSSGPRRETVPKETLRLVIEHGRTYRGPEWTRATRDGQEGMGLHVRWTVTNITNAPIKIADSYLELRPQVHGVTFVRRSDRDIYGDYSLLPRHPVPASTSFTIIPAIRKQGKDLKVTVVIVDNLGNPHRIKVHFRGR